MTLTELLTWLFVFLFLIFSGSRFEVGNYYFGFLWLLNLRLIECMPLINGLFSQFLEVWWAEQKVVWERSKITSYSLFVLDSLWKWRWNNFISIFLKVRKGQNLLILPIFLCLKKKGRFKGLFSGCGLNFTRKFWEGRVTKLFWHSPKSFHHLRAPASKYPTQTASYYFVASWLHQLFEFS